MNESLTCWALCLAQRHLGVLTVIICSSHLCLCGLHQQSGVERLDLWMVSLPGGLYHLPCLSMLLAVCCHDTQTHTHTTYTHLPAWTLMASIQLNSKAPYLSLEGNLMEHWNILLKGAKEQKQINKKGKTTATQHSKVKCLVPCGLGSVTSYLSCFPSIFFLSLLTLLCLMSLKV